MLDNISHAQAKGIVFARAEWQQPACDTHMQCCVLRCVILHVNSICMWKGRTQLFRFLGGDNDKTVCIWEKFPWKDSLRVIDVYSCLVNRRSDFIAIAFYLGHTGLVGFAMNQFFCCCCFYPDCFAIPTCHCVAVFTVTVVPLLCCFEVGYRFNCLISVWCRREQRLNEGGTFKGS